MALAMHEEEGAFLTSESEQVAAALGRPRSWKRTALLATAGLSLVAFFSSSSWSWTSHEDRTSSMSTFVQLADADPVHGCSDREQDCLKSRCCHIDGMQCFEKNEFWAVCNATCEPGVHAGEDNKGWTCSILEPHGAGDVLPVEEAPGAAPAKPPPAACSVDNGEDCSGTKCCQDPDQHCFRKNEFYATCKQDCIPQVQEGDKDQKPWSCKILLPGMEEETTTPAPAQGFAPGPTPPPQPEHPDPPGVHTPKIECDDAEAPKIPQFSGYEGPKTPMIKVLTYNLFWWTLFGLQKGNGNSAGLLVRSTNSPLPWDLMGLQECESAEVFIRGTGLQDQMEISQFHPMIKTAAICMAYRKTAFELIAQGGDYVGEDLQSEYYGKRVVQWLRLLHRESGKNVFFMNHHGPLPVQTGGKCGGHVTGVHILRVIANNAQEGDAIIFTGDFNAAPGSDTLKVISQRLKDFVPAGIDNIFSNLPVGSMVRNMGIGKGGSDHEARLAVFQLGKVPKEDEKAPVAV